MDLIYSGEKGKGVNMDILRKSHRIIEYPKTEGTTAIIIPESCS